MGWKIAVGRAEEKMRQGRSQRRKVNTCVFAVWCRWVGGRSAVGGLSSLLLSVFYFLLATQEDYRSTKILPLNPIEIEIKPLPESSAGKGLCLRRMALSIVVVVAFVRVGRFSAHCTTLTLGAPEPVVVMAVREVVKRPKSVDWDGVSI